MPFENAVIFVTGGAGFIGSAVIRHLLDADRRVRGQHRQAHLRLEPRFNSAGGRRRPVSFRATTDIGNAPALRALFDRYQPHAVMNLAAESHADRSIDDPADFIQTNVVGTFTQLQEALRYWSKLPPDAQDAFRLHHVSTDEVHGSLGSEGSFSETAAYAPNSPYAASKASSDHLVRAWLKTYGLPTITTNCSNNFGPYHFPEKLIPHIIIKGIAGEPLPVYGDRRHVRDWLYVETHCPRAAARPRTRPRRRDL